MVDTVRTKAALQALFADNSSGDISPQDLRDFLVTTYADGGINVVADHGAVGDGVTDDTAAFQAAIDAAIGAYDSLEAAVIYVPPSTSPYLINGTIHVRYNSLRLVGGGGMYHGARLKFAPDSSAWTDPEGSSKK